MSSTFGENLKLTVFGESHSEAIGMTLEGVPAGETIDEIELREFMERRAPGRDKLSTARREPDVPEFLSGLFECVTTGTPITAIIKNTDTRSGDYDDIKDAPRPGHADFTAHVKYNGYEDYRGGGHFSGRLTAPICIAGGIVKQILKRKGVSVKAAATEIAGVEFGTFAENGFEIKIDEAEKEKALAKIEEAKADGDSVGGIISCTVTGLAPGIGAPMFGGVENVIAQGIFGIPAVKGVEFGEGFRAARLRGSENNDPYIVGENGDIKPASNHHGGALGGITSGMPVTFRVAMKPTPSIAKAQDTVKYETKEKIEMRVKGRHDPCVALRAVPVVEAVAALAVYDMMLGR